MYELNFYAKINKDNLLIIIFMYVFIIKVILLWHKMNLIKILYLINYVLLLIIILAQFIYVLIRKHTVKDKTSLFFMSKTELQAIMV